VAVLLHDLADLPPARQLQALVWTWGAAIAGASQHEGARRLSEELAQSNRELAEAQDRLLRAESMARLGEMAAGVAHEIRNSLNGIDGFAALLGRELVSGGENEDVSRYADRIRRGVSEINAIVSNLLGFAAPQGLQNGRVDLHRLLTSVCTEAQEFAPEEVSIRFRSRVEHAVEVEGDTVKLRVVFLNLIRNAVEAVHEDGSVQVTLEAERKKLIVRVCDDGPGLAPAMRLKLFRPFSTTKAQGTGLGLAIAHKVTALHGGTIEHEESVRGCTFRVELPAAIEEINE